MRAKLPEITITAPQGWGKTTLVDKIAEHIADWKAGRVEIEDGELTPRAVYPRHGAVLLKTVAVIRVQSRP